MEAIRQSKLVESELSLAINRVNMLEMTRSTFDVNLKRIEANADQMRERMMKHEATARRAIATTLSWFDWF